MMHPRKALAEWRDAQGLSQEEARKRIQPVVSQSTWAGWESGGKWPNLENALAIERLTRGAVRARDWVRARKQQAA